MNNPDERHLQFEVTHRVTVVTNGDDEFALKAVNQAIAGLGTQMADSRKRHHARTTHPVVLKRTMRDVTPREHP